ncbi:hypothetical protein V2J09_019436 [Rumex salicifolius]
MEGSESEAIFESLNLKPQLFVNEVLNSVDDLVDGAFDFFHHEASALLNTNDTDRAADLKKAALTHVTGECSGMIDVIDMSGVDYIHHRVQASLYKRLDMWEKYCLHYCFVVPDRFLLPDKDEPMNEFEVDVNVLTDQQSDSELDTLRSRLSQIDQYKVGKDSAELNKQLQALERQNNMSNHCAAALTESLKLYDQNAHELFGEMMKTAMELRAKMEKLRVKRMEENEQGRRERINGSNEDISNLTCSKDAVLPYQEDEIACVKCYKNPEKHDFFHHFERCYFKPLYTLFSFHSQTPFMGRLSNTVITAINAINAITSTVALAVLGFYIYLRFFAGEGNPTHCQRTLQWPVLVGGLGLLAVSVMGLLGYCCRVRILMWAYVGLIFLIIVGWIAFSVFVFAVTNSGAGKAVSGFGFSDQTRLGDYSHWLQKRVMNGDNWRQIKSCLVDANVCDKDIDFYKMTLSPIQLQQCWTLFVLP